MWIGAGSILIYTLFGGMWAVAITDLVQMIVIVLGLLYIGGEVSDMVGGVSVVVNHAAAAGKLEFWPEADLKAIIAFMAAACHYDVRFYATAGCVSAGAVGGVAEKIAVCGGPSSVALCISCLRLSRFLSVMPPTIVAPGYVVKPDGV